MALLNEVVFAVSLIASGFGPILYSTRVLLNDFSLFDSGSVLLNDTQGLASGVHLYSSEVSSAQLADTSILEDSNQADVSVSISYTTTKFVPPVLPSPTKAHNLHHILHPSNSDDSGATVAKFGNAVLPSNVHVVQTSGQELPQYVTFSGAMPTPFIRLPTDANTSPTIKEAPNDQPSGLPTGYIRVVFLVSALVKLVAKPVLELLRAFFLLFVGVLIGISFSYSSTLLSLWHNYVQHRGCSAVTCMDEFISTWSFSKRNSTAFPKRKNFAQPGADEVSYHQCTFLHSIPRPETHVTCNIIERVAATDNQCKDKARYPVVSSDDEAIYAYDSYHSDAETESNPGFSTPSENGSFGARDIDQFCHRVADSADEPNKRLDISDVTSVMHQEGNPSTVRVDDGISTTKDECSEARNLVDQDQTAPAPLRGNRVNLHVETTDFVNPVREAAATDAPNDEMDHFFLTSVYIPPHKRLSGHQVKEALSWRATSTPPRSSLQQEPLSKPRQFQYDFFKGFLENFGQGGRASTYLSDAHCGAPADRELDWRHRESKSQLFGKWRFSRLAGRLKRIVEENDVEKPEESVVPHSSDDDDGVLHRKTSMTLPKTCTHHSSAEGQQGSLGSRSPYRLARGSLSGNWSSVLEVSDYSARNDVGNEGKSGTQPLQMVPTRVLLLHDEPKLRSCSSRDENALKLTAGGESRGQAIEQEGRKRAQVGAGPVNDDDGL